MGRVLDMARRHLPRNVQLFLADAYILTLHLLRQIRMWVLLVFTVRWDPCNMGRRPMSAQIARTKNRVDVLITEGETRTVRRLIRYFWSYYDDCVHGELVELATKFNMPPKMRFSGGLSFPESTGAAHVRINRDSNLLYMPTTFTLELDINKRAVVCRHTNELYSPQICTHTYKLPTQTMDIASVLDVLIGSDVCGAFTNQKDKKRQ